MVFEDHLTGSTGNCYGRFGEMDIHITIAELGHRHEGECYVSEFVTFAGIVGQRFEAEFICRDSTHDTTVSTTTSDVIGHILVIGISIILQQVLSWRRCNCRLICYRLGAVEILSLGTMVSGLKRAHFGLV